MIYERIAIPELAVPVSGDRPGNAQGAQRRARRGRRAGTFRGRPADRRLSREGDDRVAEPGAAKELAAARAGVLCDRRARRFTAPADAAGCAARGIATAVVDADRSGVSV